MKDYIQKTLDEINAEIAVLEELRDGIERHFEKGADERTEETADKPVRTVAKLDHKKPSRKPSAKVKEKDLSGGDGEYGPLRIGSLQHKALIEARKFSDPFTVEKMASAMGIERTAAGQCLLALAKKELIEEVWKDGQMKTYVVKNG